MRAPGTRVARWVRWLCAVPLLVVLGGGAALVFYIVVLSDGTTAAASPSPTADPGAPLIVAVGDSFISGEGAKTYLAGTNNPGNSCHRANTGYPYLVATARQARLVNASCSGAVIRDFEEPQYPDSPDTTYGGLPQMEALAAPRITPDGPVEPGSIDVVLLSISGNDAGFGEVVRTCLNTNCLRYEPEWMARLETLQPQLAAFYPKIKDAAQGARVLVVPYPDPLVVGDCVRGLSTAEAEFLINRFLPRLNLLITFAAEQAGLEVVDSQDAFAGARNCEPGVTADGATMNTIDLGRAGNGPGDVVRGSFHPRELGHRLLAKVVLDHLQQPPTADPLGCQPFGCPPGPPPNPPIPPPGGDPIQFPPGIACGGDILQNGELKTVAADQDALEIAARADSTVCFSFAGQPWRTAQAAGDGTARIDVAQLARAEVPTLTVIQSTTPTQWTRDLYLPPAGVNPTDPAWWQQLSGLLLSVVLAAVALAIAPYVVEWVRRRRRGRVPA